MARTQILPLARFSAKIPCSRGHSQVGLLGGRRLSAPLTMLLGRPLQPRRALPFVIIPSRLTVSPIEGAISPTRPTYKAFPLKIPRPLSRAAFLLLAASRLTLRKKVSLAFGETAALELGTVAARLATRLTAIPLKLGVTFPFGVPRLASLRMPTRVMCPLAPRRRPSDIGAGTGAPRLGGLPQARTSLAGLMRLAKAVARAALRRRRLSQAPFVPNRLLTLGTATSTDVARRRTSFSQAAEPIPAARHDRTTRPLPPSSHPFDSTLFYS